MLVLVYPNIFIIPSCAGQIGGTEDGWVQNPTNQHYYKLTEPMSWLRAEDQANKWGGHLVTINNWAEESWLRSQFGMDEFFWIGFTDIFAEGNWQWISGEPVTYTNWWPWEPNNEGAYGEIEGAAIINWGGAEVIDGEWFYYYGDGWNDNSIDNKYRGIVEMPQLIVTFWDKEEPTREVMGAAADGASEVIIRISGLPEDAGQDYVQISLPNGEVDGSLDSNIQILNGVFEQIYLAPKDFVRKGHAEDLNAAKREVRISIITRSGGVEIEHQPFYLFKPPVVLIHGIWGKSSDFNAMLSFLTKNYLNGNTVLVYSARYPNDRHFSQNIGEPARLVSTAINNARWWAAKRPIVVKKADIVAHSMGGILSELYVNSPGYRHDVNRMVTIGTPHCGSELANFGLYFLYNEELPRRQRDITIRVFNSKGKSLTKGAVEDLQVGSEAIKGYRQQLSMEIPVYAIRVTHEGGQPDLDLQRLYKLFWYWDHSLATGLFEGSDNPDWDHKAINLLAIAVEEGLFGCRACSDYVVSLTSQTGGASVYIDKPAKDHIKEPANPKVMLAVTEALNLSVSSFDQHGFSPPACNPPARVGVQVVPQDIRLVMSDQESVEISGNGGGLTIISPSNGDTFAPGDSVVVTIACDGVICGNVFLLSQDFLVGGDDSTSCEFELTVDDDFVGSMPIAVWARNDDGSFQYDYIEVNIVTNEIPEQIITLPSSPLYLEPDYEVILCVEGTYVGGVVRDITSIETTHYNSSDPNIVQVSTGGVITAMSQGQAVVTIENSGITEEIEIVVAPGSVPLAPQLIDDFNDNTQDTQWDILESNHNNCWLAETNDRLELRSAGGAVSESVAMYLSHAWSLAGPRDFAFQVDFHYSDLTGKEGMLFLLLSPASSTENIDDRVVFAAGCDQDGPCFYHSVVDGGEEYLSDRISRTAADGTLYVRYIAESDELHFDYSDQNSVNSWQVLPGLLRGLWTSGPLSIGVGGVTFGANLDSEEAYLDNFVIETGDIVHPADDNCDYKIGDLEMAVYRARWREGYVTDKDLHDVELLSKAGHYYWSPVSQNFNVAESELTYIQMCSGTLEAGQVVEGSDSTATGSFKVLVTEDGSTVKLEVEHTVAEPTLLRICEGDLGTAGTVILSFENPVSPFTHYFTEAEKNQMEDLDGVYIDIVDASHSQGAIRGQAICVEDLCTGKGTAALLEGSLDGCLVNNESNGGGNGFLRLCHANFPNQNAYNWCGLNFEHIFNGVDSYDMPYGIYDQGRSRFSPRKDPCKLVIHSPKSASLIWIAEDSVWGMNTEMRYTLKGPHYIDLECYLVPREYHSYRGWLSTFWASYMNHTKDRKIYFYGIDLSTGREGWITWGENLEQNGFEGGVISHVNAPDLPYDPEVYSGDIVADANKKFVMPFYFGLVDGDGVDSEGEGISDGEIWTGSNDADAMVYIMMFDQDEPIRFCMWNWGPPLGTGLPSNPAWDWQYVILDPHLGQEYKYRARLVFKPWRGIEDVVNEYETWLNELSGKAEGENTG
jgi:pimeloyl-ACP methyl ester carboxylesterase